MAASRTTTGCWTCRIRKKKCDDVQPFCGPCSFRQLTCHGFGPKPTWMDSAENQMEEIERIKQAVNQSFRSRRAFRVSKKSTVPSRVVQAVNEKRLFVSSNSTPEAQQPMSFQYQDTSSIGEPQLSDRESDTIVPLPWPDGQEDHVGVLQPAEPRLDHHERKDIGPPAAEIWSFNPEGHNVVPPSAELWPQIREGGAIVRQQVEPWPGGQEGNTVSLPLLEPWPKVKDSEPLNSSVLRSLSSIARHSHKDPQILGLSEDEKAAYPFSFHPEAPPAENEHDLTMIMNYLDNIFPLQFYFYKPSNSERGRGWLLSLLLRAKSLYFTALTFSSLHQIMFVYKDNIAIQQKLSLDLDRYHSLGLSELQQELDYLLTISGYEHLKMGVEILACMMQLLSIEVFRSTKDYKGWKGDWEVHLDAAGTILSVIGTDLRTSSSSPESADGDEESELKSSQTKEITPLLPLNEIAGLDFFMKVYIWCDVIRCASIGVSKSERKSFPYLTYLKEDRIRLDHIMGCRNWVMMAIKEISNLETWKNDLQSRRSLSIPALSRRAAELEQRLHYGLKTFMKDHDTLSTYEQECNLVTEIYALSALTYLAVVVSGNSHVLPEVRSSVGRTLTALKELPQHLLIRISWAYCVAGCMADENMKEEFRQLLFESEKAGYHLGTLWNCLEIMEEFWTLRENLNFVQAADKCSWALAMDSLGVKILLI